MSNSIPRIKEDLKRDILAYLVHSVRENEPLEKINYSGILDEMGEDSKKNRALSHFVFNVYFSSIC